MRLYTLGVGYAFCRFARYTFIVAPRKMNQQVTPRKSESIAEVEPPAETLFAAVKPLVQKYLLVMDKLAPQVSKALRKLCDHMRGFGGFPARSSP